jgi:hypothetical protein
MKTPDVNQSHLEKPIFRKEAVQYYMQRVNQDVIPRFITQRVFNWLWLLITIIAIVIGFIVLNLASLLPQ